jgi:hypothetical protein
MSFTGHEDHFIPLPEASEWTANYRNVNAAGSTIAHFFGKDAIQAILNQSNCVGIRIYYAIDNLGEKQLIIVGANAAENDLYQGLLADKSYPCPAQCSTPNPLNSNI